MNKIVAVLVFIALAGIVAGLIYTRRPLPDRPEPYVELPEPAAEPEQPQHPIPQREIPQSEAESPPPEPLPQLDESDPLVLEDLGELVGEGNTQSLFKQDELIRNIVVTIDNLPRSKVAVGKRPVQPVPGPFQVVGDNQSATLSADNYVRYEPFISMVKDLNTDQAVAIYLRLYPLFQQAYEGLGYPDEHFNDRLVEVLDHLIEASNVGEPIDLVRPKVFYEFADQQLEASSAGRKLLLRMGPDNATVVKNKLQEIRDQVASDASTQHQD